MRGRLARGAIAAVVAVAVAVAAVVWSTDDEGSGSGERPAGTATTVDKLPTAGSIAELTGTGDQQTDVFEAATNWELRWSTAAAGSFTVELFAEDGTSRGVIVDEPARTSGSVFVSEEGSFYLAVTADTAWELEILGRPPG